MDNHIGKICERAKKTTKRLLPEVTMEMYAAHGSRKPQSSKVCHDDDVIERYRNVIIGSRNSATSPPR
jgi:hypothetical protein